MSRSLDPRQSRRKRGTLAGTVAVVALITTAFTSCSGERPQLEGASAGTAPASTTSLAVTTTTIDPLAEQPLSPDTMLGYIATPFHDVAVWSEPDESSAPLPVPETTPVGVPTTFAVVGEPLATGAEWYQVVLPVRPNGASGWVKADSVTLSKTDLRVFVDLDAKNIRVERAGEEVMATAVAIGKEANQTPTGATFVTELIQTIDAQGKPNPDGAYGPYAFGLALHSDTITEFGDGGDGQVGIHGTNRPDLIGEPVSSGCIRLANEDILKLVDLQLPLGVPVFIT